MNRHMCSTILLLVAAFYLSSCTIPVTPDNRPSTNPRPEALPPPATEDEINQLLGLAEQALAKQRLTTPADDNAYLRYLQVLARDPDNTYALAGIARIVETYLSWAVAAIEQDSYVRAANMLTKAGSVDEAHPALKPLWSRLEAARQREKQIIKISENDLKLRSPELASQLQAIATDHVSNEVVVKIRAATDADARWIYQQLNLGTENRIRATINTGHSPSVQLSHP